MTENIFDVIVVGSGPSGGRIALEMINAGAKVLMLEAGPHFRAKDFPKPEVLSSAHLFWGGGIELNTSAQLGFLRARCVGGTSIVNQALLDRFDNDVWTEWSEISGMNFTESYVEEAYEEVENSLSLQKIEKKHFNQNSQLFTTAFDKKGLGWTPLRRGQTDCALDKGNDCIVCLGGCHRNSKQSTMATWIATAEKKGLQIQANCEVESISQSGTPNSIKAFIKENGQKRPVEFKTRAVVLAAGSFGTSKILLQSQYAARSPQIGKGISCHPQYMSYSFFDQPIDAYKGAFQAVKSDDKNLRQMGIKFENVFAPPIATSMLFDGYGREHQAIMKKYRYMSSMEVAIRDEASGELAVKNGKLIIKKEITKRDRERANNGLKLVREMFDSVGGKNTIQCSQGFGLHLMGGCAIGTDSKKSVVAPDFSLHENKNVFVADSSIFPSAPGLNPSLTIMAFSHMAAGSIRKALA
jgi:choline dehydrogenase-like flavoprotein